LKQRKPRNARGIGKKLHCGSMQLQSSYIPKRNLYDVLGFSVPHSELSVNGGKREPRKFLYRESPGYGGQQSIRVDDWKAIRKNLNPNQKVKDQKPSELKLYNLATDPNEESNVADKNPEVVARLRAIMEREHVKSDIFPMRALDGEKWWQRWCKIVSKECRRITLESELQSS
jgi:hypothetical protein